MDTREWVSLLSVAGPIVGGLATLGLVIGGLVRHFSRKLSKAEVRARRAEKEREEAASQAKEAKLLAERARQEREQAERDRVELLTQLDRLTSAAKKNHEVATHNFQVCKKAKERVELLQKAVKQYQAQIDVVAKQDGRVWLAPHLAKPPEFMPLVKRHSRRPVIISVFNLKGGVGKTTLTANLGGYLACCLAKSVLLLDLDHQRSLTQTVFTTEKRKAAAAAKRTVQDLLHPGATGEDVQKVAEQVQGDGFERLWLVGNSDADDGHGNPQNLDDLEMDLLGKWLVDPAKCDIRYLLRGALHSPVIQDRYDYVLIDCPPRLTTACVNALAASDFLLIPAQADQVSSRSVPHLLKRLRTLRDAGVLPDLNSLGVVANMVSADVDKPHSREVKLLETTANAASKRWVHPVRLLKNKIRQSDYYPACQRESDRRLRLPSVAVAAIREQYEKLTKELEGIIHESIGVAGVSS